MLQTDPRFLHFSKAHGAVMLEADLRDEPVAGTTISVDESGLGA